MTLLAATRGTPPPTAKARADIALDEPARRSLDRGPWCQEVVQRLNDALATELACVLHYRHHPYTVHDESLDLSAMIRSNLEAGRAVIGICSQVIGLIGDRDPSARGLIEDILMDERARADELKNWFDD